MHYFDPDFAQISTLSIQTVLRQVLYRYLNSEEISIQFVEGHLSTVCVDEKSYLEANLIQITLPFILLQLGLNNFGKTCTNVKICLNLNVFKDMLKLPTASYY